MCTKRGRAKSNWVARTKEQAEKTGAYIPNQESGQGLPRATARLPDIRRQLLGKGVQPRARKENAARKAIESLSYKVSNIAATTLQGPDAVIA